jgi:Exostosin family
VYLLSAAPDDPDGFPKAYLDLEQLRDSAHADSFGVHRLVDDPGAADLILFVETDAGAGDYFHRVKRHPTYRQFGAKSYLFAAEDKVVPFLPGVYAGIERRWYRQAWTRSGFYPGVKESGELRYEPNASPSRLYTFVGAANAHPVRQRIMQLPDTDAVLIDSHAESQAVERGEIPPVPEEEFRGRYVRALRESAFVLCPRGGGTTSFRLFEAMMLGRVPVIISDQWVPPEGPDWDSFSVSVEESAVDRIPALLEARREQAAAMGAAARQAWVEWFSPQAGFHRTAEWCLDLARYADARGGLRRYQPYLQMLRPYHAARSVAKRLGHGR